MQLGGDLLDWSQPPGESTAQFITTGYINRPRSAGKTIADTQAGVSPPSKCRNVQLFNLRMSQNNSSVQLVVVLSVPVPADMAAVRFSVSREKHWRLSGMDVIFRFVDVAT